MAKPLITRVVDGLANLVTGAGTTSDKNAASFYAFTHLSQQQAEAAYRSSWLTRKIVDVPPFDMTREWRDWQAEADQIKALEAEECRLMLRHRARRALVLARLFGGSAIILGVNQGAPSDPLRPEALGKGCLAYTHTVSRYQLTLGPADLDPASPYFGRPAYFEMNAGSGARVRLHPSRVIAFVGQEVPEVSALGAESWFWGDPVMQIIGDAIKNADLAQAGFATLINEAAVDIIGIPDLMSSVASPEYEAQFLKRMAIVRMGKSMHRALIKDAGETWEQRQVTWNGMPEMLNAYLQIVAGAADIPITRLLGTSPKGLQSNGDGEERDYISMIISQQDGYLRPQLEALDDVLIRSALGSRPDNVSFLFAPIAHANAKTLAEIDLLQAQTTVALANTGLLPEVALAKAVENRMIESGQWPGLDVALADAAAAGELDPTEMPGRQGDPSEIVPLNEPPGVASDLSTKN